MKLTSKSSLRDLSLALAKSGWTESEIRTLSQENMLLNLRAMLELSPHLLNPPKTVDLSADVDVQGLSVNWNKKQKRIIWNPNDFKLFQTTKQLQGKDIGALNHAFDIRDNHQPVNACLLKYLLTYPFFIPKIWRQHTDGRCRYICFLGTTYSDRGDHRIFARGMYFNGNVWVEAFWPISTISHPDFCVVVPKVK